MLAALFVETERRDCDSQNDSLTNGGAPASIDVEAGQRTSSTGVEHRASTFVATEPSTRLATAP